MPDHQREVRYSAQEATAEGLLRDKLARLERELAELSPGPAVPTEPVQYGKRAGDHIAQISDQLARARAAEELAKLADQVRAALVRLEAGGYGSCERCQRPIPAGRLEALPWAVRCVDCAGLR